MFRNCGRAVAMRCAGPASRCPTRMSSACSARCRPASDRPGSESRSSKAPWGPIRGCQHRNRTPAARSLRLLALQRTLSVWRRSTGAQSVDADAELFQSVCGRLGMATASGCDACLMVLDDFPRVLQAAPARRVRQGKRLDQCVRGSVDLVQRDLGIFPPAAGSFVAPETSG